MSHRLIINDSWVLDRNGLFSSSFSGFIKGMTGGFDLSAPMKDGLAIARSATKGLGSDLVEPIFGTVESALGIQLPPAVREKLQRKLDLAEKRAQQRLDEAQEQYDQKLDEVMREKEKAYDAKIEQRLAQMEAEQDKQENSIGQKIASQLFSVKMDSLVEALHSVAQERGITNEQLLRIIRALPEFEALMYIMNVRKFYRDHTAHSLRVAALGDYLLDKEGVAGSLEGLLMEKLGFTKDQVRTTWWFTGLLHDIGTPLAKLSKSLNWSLINEMTRCYSALGMDFSPLKISVNHPTLGNVRYLKILTKGYPKSWQNIITNGLGNGKDTGDLYRYSATGLHHTEYKPISSGIDHGVIAAVTLLRILGTPEEIENNPSEFGPMIEAARAIALHDAIEKLQPLPFEEYPLLFLLAVCDELQEWGRPIPVSTEEGYFTTALQKVTLTDAIFHDTSSELWDVPFTNDQAKTLMRFDFKRLHKDKEIKLKGLDCSEQFPETKMLLIDYDKATTHILDKYEIKIQSL